MSTPTAEYVVAVELDSGLFEMVFEYVPIGVPAFSDVPAEGVPAGTHGQAELTGAHMLWVGNWRSFRVEKRYRPALTGSRVAGREGRA